VCDYSLDNVKSRAAKVGDKLTICGVIAHQCADSLATLSTVLIVSTFPRRSFTQRRKSSQSSGLVTILMAR
jgi:hypothetical protein